MQNTNKSVKTNKTFEKIVSNLQNIVDSGEYAKFLKFQKNFRGYSFNNLVLIYSQFPDATKVAGKSKWLKMNRTLLPNPQRIYILAPVPRKYTVTEKVIENGEKIEKTKVIEYNWYKNVYVYDISQTIGEKIPLQSHDIESDNMGFFYEKLKQFSKVPVYEREITGGAKGYYNNIKKEIVIKKSLSTDDRAAVLLHEIAHSLYDDFDYKNDRNLSEVFVESVAFTVADYFGLDTSSCSFSYILGWAHGDIKVVIDLGNKIKKCADEFITELENFYSLIQEERMAA